MGSERDSRHPIGSPIQLWSRGRTHPIHSRMIHVRLLVELPADAFGPHEFYVERLVLPPSFAASAFEAHAKLLTMLATEDYFELPRHGAVGVIPLNAETVRVVAVWEG